MSGACLACAVGGAAICGALLALRHALREARRRRRAREADIWGHDY